MFCLLANRVQFSKEDTQAQHQSISHSRGILCELLAQRILRRFNEDYRGVRGLLVLANILVSGFDTFQNAPTAIAEEHSRAFRWIDEGKMASERKLTALEIAIISDSKNFLCSRQCQRVVEAIYQGKIVYTPTSFVDILPDRYKRKSIGLYNPRDSPLLDQYRLMVPRTRYYLEIFHFVVLVALYILQMETRRNGHFTWQETLFCVYTFGWMLDQCATILEHGWSVYTQNLWTYLDVSFSTSFLLYFVLRVIGHGHGHPEITEVAFDVLAMGAPFLVPRLAFNVLSENMLFVSLREMISNFVVLTLLAVWCFGGFLLASSWMSRGQHSPLTIAKWMLWLWFGLDAEGIQLSPQFHWLLGPVLMISFAFLGNTLFLTILVSMLSNTFATISANSEAEIQYRRTVVTFEGVKADAIFSFPPPFNLLALLILIPLKPFLSPRYFHKVIVYSVRTLNLPLLLALSAWERRELWGTAENPAASSSPGWWRALQARLQWDISSLAVHGDLATVFEAEPPKSILSTGRDGHRPSVRSLPPGVPSANGGDGTGPKDGKGHGQGGGSGSGNGQLGQQQQQGEGEQRKDSLAVLFGLHPHHSSFDAQGRKESMGPFSEVTEHLQELFQEHFGSFSAAIGGAGGGGGGGGGGGMGGDGASGGGAATGGTGATSIIGRDEGKARFEALERSMARMEEQLGRICESMGVEGGIAGEVEESQESVEVMEDLQAGDLAVVADLASAAQVGMEGEERIGPGGETSPGLWRKSSVADGGESPGLVRRTRKGAVVAGSGERSPGVYRKGSVVAGDERIGPDGERSPGVWRKGSVVAASEGQTSPGARRKSSVAGGGQSPGVARKGSVVPDVEEEEEEEEGKGQMSAEVVRKGSVAE